MAATQRRPILPGIPLSLATGIHAAPDALHLSGSPAPPAKLTSPASMAVAWHLAGEIWELFVPNDQATEATLPVELPVDWACVAALPIAFVPV